jgi:curved DNA-binding protein CbpA
MTFDRAFEILGLRTKVTVKAILERYRKLAKKYHPDLNGSHEGMIRLLEAKNKAIKYNRWDDPYSVAAYYRNGMMCGPGYIVQFKVEGEIE